MASNIGGGVFVYSSTSKQNENTDPRLVNSVCKLQGI